jgi:hypothetical protein
MGNRKNKKTALPARAWCHSIIEVLDIVHVYKMDLKAVFGAQQYMSAIIGIREAAERVCKEGTCVCMHVYMYT